MVDNVGCAGVWTSSAFAPLAVAGFLKHVFGHRGAGKNRAHTLRSFLSGAIIYKSGAGRNDRKLLQPLLSALQLLSRQVTQNSGNAGRCALSRAISAYAHIVKSSRTHKVLLITVADTADRIPKRLKILRILPTFWRAKMLTALDTQQPLQNS
jgi:hypothetical protein